MSLFFDQTISEPILPNMWFLRGRNILPTKDPGTQLMILGNKNIPEQLVRGKIPRAPAKIKSVGVT